MKLFRRAAWIALLLAPLFFGAALLLSSRLGNALVLTDRGYCITMRTNPSTGRLEEVPKSVDAAFTTSLFGAFVAPPVLWFAVLISRWKHNKTKPTLI
jgi:hypothetical protein